MEEQNPPAVKELLREKVQAESIVEKITYILHMEQTASNLKKQLDAAYRKVGELTQQLAESTEGKERLQGNINTLTKSVQDLSTQVAEKVKGIN